MKALVLHSEPLERLKIQEIPIPELTSQTVRIVLKAAALNHRDVFIRDGKYAKIQTPCVLGSDGAGVVEAVSDDISPELAKQLLGQEVVINPSINWGNNERAQSAQYTIVGMPTQGTFAEYIVVPLTQISPKPAHLTFEEAAALPLAGLTAFRAVCVQAQVQSGEKVLVTGIGGGVARFAAQFALACGADVWITSGSNEKIQKVQLLPEFIVSGRTISGGVSYKQVGWDKELSKLSGGFDVVIDGAGGNDLNGLISCVKPGGRIVMYGATNGRPHELNVQAMFWKQISLIGSTMGSDKNFSEMIDFIALHGIRPSIDSIRSFSEIIHCFDEMCAGKQQGKLVVRF